MISRTVRASSRLLVRCGRLRVLPQPLIEGRLITVVEKATPLSESNGRLLERRRRPNVRKTMRANDASWPDSDRWSIGVRKCCCLNFCLFRHLKRIVNLDAQVSHCAFKLGMAK